MIFVAVAAEHIEDQALRRVRLLLLIILPHLLMAPSIVLKRRIAWSSSSSSSKLLLLLLLLLLIISGITNHLLRAHSSVASFLHRTAVAIVVVTVDLIDKEFNHRAAAAFLEYQRDRRRTDCC